MIKKFEIFERVYNEMDPYGEERWGDNEYQFDIEIFTHAKLSDKIDRDNLKDVIIYTMRSIGDDPNTPHGAFQIEMDDKILKKYPDNRIVIFQTEKSKEIRKKSFENYEIEFGDDEILMKFKYEIELPDFEDDDVTEWVLTDLNFNAVYVFNEMENVVANKPRNKQYREIQGVFEELNRNLKITISADA